MLTRQRGRGTIGVLRPLGVCTKRPPPPTHDHFQLPPAATSSGRTLTLQGNHARKKRQRLRKLIQRNRDPFVNGARAHYAGRLLSEPRPKKPRRYGVAPQSTGNESSLPHTSGFRTCSSPAQGDLGDSPAVPIEERYENKDVISQLSRWENNAPSRRRSRRVPCASSCSNL